MAAAPGPQRPLRSIQILKLRVSAMSSWHGDIRWHGAAVIWQRSSWDTASRLPSVRSPPMVWVCRLDRVRVAQTTTSHSPDEGMTAGSLSVELGGAAVAVSRFRAAIPTCWRWPARIWVNAVDRLMVSDGRDHDALGPVNDLLGSGRRGGLRVGSRQMALAVGAAGAAGGISHASSPGSQPSFRI